jgi:hypothetical protein
VHSQFTASELDEAELDTCEREVAWLEHRHRYLLRKFTSDEEQVRRVLVIPAEPRRRLGLRRPFLAHGLPALMLAMTSQQVLITRDSLLRARQGAQYGCDAWRLPLQSVASVELKLDRMEARLAFELGSSETRHIVDFRVPELSTGTVEAFALAIREQVASDAATTTGHGN